MAFRCPECQGPSLALTHGLELPPDGRSVETTLQVVRCAKCNFAGLAVYEESRRGSLKSSSFHHLGYRCSPATVEWIVEFIQQCPAPGSGRCRCPTHLTLGSTQDGIWRGLGAIGVSVSKPFPLDMAQ